jgi:hypothetical protein
MDTKGYSTKVYYNFSVSKSTIMDTKLEKVWSRKSYSQYSNTLFVRAQSSNTLEFMNRTNLMKLTLLG